MYFLSKPGYQRIQDFLRDQRERPFSYEAVGATDLETGRTPDYLPPGYVVDHHRTPLGAGAETYARAKSALQAWRMFEGDWLGLFVTPPVVAPGTVVAILAQLPLLWSLNAARIVYVLEQAGAVERYGFAYGTLPEHAERGEERFSVEWHRQDDSVWFDILAFSKPQDRLAQWGYPVARLLQRRFATDAMVAMRRAMAARSSRQAEAFSRVDTARM